MLKQILIAIEKAGRNYSAYAPDIPGCISVGMTAEEAKKNIVEALEAHIEAMAENNFPIELPNENTVYCLVSVRTPSDQVRVTGETLRSYRKRSGLTQDELAAKLEVTKATISEWETGKRELPGTVKFALETIY